MHLTVTLEARFQRTPDGAVWTQTAFPHAFWARYLEHFDRVRVMARAEPVAAALPDSLRVDGAGVELFALPYYVGPRAFLRRLPALRQALRRGLANAEAVILRLPSAIGNLASAELRRRGHRYAVEVVADPYDVFAPGAVRHPLSPLLRWHQPRQLRRQCRSAAAAAYVTRAALQRRYPCPGRSVSVSDVELPAGAFAAAPRPPRAASAPLRLVTVGSLAQLYKGTDVLIDAVAACAADGVPLRLVVVGDGKHRAELEARAERAGVAASVRFAGQLSAGAPVRAELDAADVFVLPSRTEGLPRALLEAMARGLPCVGSRVGGIPELLPDEDLVPPGDAAALARRLTQVARDPAWLARASARNLEAAREYRDEALAARRSAFLEAAAVR